MDHPSENTIARTGLKSNKIANEIYTELITIHVTINDNKLKNQHR